MLIGDPPYPAKQEKSGDENIGAFIEFEAHNSTRICPVNLPKLSGFTRYNNAATGR